MSYGHLKVIVGPMGASKTSSLLKEALWAKNGLGRETLVFRPAFDDRYTNSGEIVTHDGLRMPATTVSTLEVLPAIINQGSLVIFDEIQFFDDIHVSGDVIELIRRYLLAGTDVTVGGLDIDVFGKPFLITAQLMAMADSIEKRHSHCAICGRPSTKTFKKGGTEETIELGTFAEIYETRCNDHWHPFRAPLFSIMRGDKT